MICDDFINLKFISKSQYKYFKKILVKRKHRIFVFVTDVLGNDIFKINNNIKCIYEDKNLGGSSIVSETVSAYLLNLIGAHEFISESNVINKSWNLDYICKIKDKNIGVSVMRAMENKYKGIIISELEKIVFKKLLKICIATGCYDYDVNIKKTILHCFCQNIEILKIMKLLFDNYIPKFKCNKIIIVLSLYNNNKLYIDDKSIICM